MCVCLKSFRGLEASNFETVTIADHVAYTSNLCHICGVFWRYTTKLCLSEYCFLSTKAMCELSHVFTGKGEVRNFINLLRNLQKMGNFNKCLFLVDWALVIQSQNPMCPGTKCFWPDGWWRGKVKTQFLRTSIKVAVSRKCLHFYRWEWKLL